ncbi:WhiB family transcriptional regulator [Streptomyces klenkii]|uniref:WhiB family transcriptional regulator n=1 Tax=Streptomyces klenkii TaxID=1420899 RepID=UPI0036EA9473
MSADWEASARCREIGPEIFAPKKYDRESVADAKDICGSCPVWKQCRADALTAETGLPVTMRATVRGGLTPRERARLDKKQKEAA